MREMHIEGQVYKQCGIKPHCKKTNRMQRTANSITTISITMMILTVRAQIEVFCAQSANDLHSQYQWNAHLPLHHHYSQCSSLEIEKVYGQLYHF